MITIRDRILPGDWRIALVEDSDRNRYIEAFDPQGAFVLNMSPSHKLYHLFETVLSKSPIIEDKKLLELYESSTKDISHKYGRTLAYARAVIELTKKTWSL